jgi:hypothetical protein
MEASRLALREILYDLMESCGETPRLYYQPNESFKMVYPCIVYHLRRMGKQNANNHAYIETIDFDVTYITRDTESKVPSSLNAMPMMVFDRYYTSENLHHYAYTYSNIVKKGG